MTTNYKYLKKEGTPVMVDGALRAISDEEPEITQNGITPGTPFSEKYATKTELGGKQDKLPTGDAGKFLKSTGADTPPEWADIPVPVKDVHVNGESSVEDGIAYIENMEVSTNKDTSIPDVPLEGHYPTTAAMKAFVNSSIASSAAEFEGNWATVDAIPSTEQGFADLGYKTPILNNYYLVVKEYIGEGETTPATWRFKYVLPSGATTYDKSYWKPEYKVGEVFTSAEEAAIKSGITAELVKKYDDHCADKENPHEVSLAQVATAEQLAAANSGITAEKVGKYEGYENGKQNKLSTQQGYAVDSGITSSKVEAYEAHIADKNNPHGVTIAQITTEAQRSAIDSGIDSSKVEAYGAHIGNTGIHVDANEKAALTGLTFEDISV